MSGSRFRVPGKPAPTGDLPGISRNADAVRTADAIDWTLDRVTSADEARERIRQLGELVPDLDRDRLWRWCQATAVALAVLRLRRRPLDDTTQLLLRLATGS